MNIYEKYVLPKLIHLAMRNKVAAAERAKSVPLASATVLEVGAGSGLNIPYYGPKVRQLYALDPSLELWKMARSRVTKAPLPVEFLASPAESIPLGNMTVARGWRGIGSTTRTCSRASGIYLTHLRAREG